MVSKINMKRKRLSKDYCLATVNPKLSKDWHSTKNGTLAPCNVTPGSNKKVWWKGNCGHEWQATVVDRNQGASCPVCANRKIIKSNCLATLNPELVKEWHPTKNEKRTPYNVHPGSSFKVWWKCKYGHEWETAVEKRAILNQGCPKCSKQTTMPELRIFSELKTIFPSIQHRTILRGHEVDIYIPELKIGIEYDGVYWHKTKHKKDEEKHYHLALPIELIRVREKGLPLLHLNDISVQKKGITVSTIKWILKIILRKRDITSPEILSKINKYMETKDWVAAEHFRKLCTERNHINFEESISYLCPKLAKEWHPTKNDPLLPEYFPPGTHKRVWWKCPSGDDHVWKAAIYSRVAGHGCPICAGKKAVKSNCLATLNPKLVAEWHPTKNKDLTPYDVRPGTHKKVWWKCPKGEDHEWRAEVRHRVEGIGCPFCSNKRISKDNCLAITSPTIAKEWHPTKNNDLTPYDVTYGLGQKVWWRCKRGHEWEAIISNRARRGDGCPMCRKEKAKTNLRQKKKNSGQLDLF